MSVSRIAWEQLGSRVAIDQDLLVIGFSADEITSGLAKDRIAHLQNMIVPNNLLILLSSSDATLHKTMQELSKAPCIQKPVALTALKRTLVQIFTNPASLPAVPEYRSSEAPSFSGRRFIVADDNKINLQLISNILSTSGAEIVEAENGVEVVNAYRQQHPDLIIIDVHMPVMDGKEATRQIREMEHGEIHTPIIALSADVIPEHRDALISAGVDIYLTKPVDDNKLWQAIDSLINIGHSSSLTTELPLASDENETNSMGALAIHDIQEALRITGGREELADEMFRKFMDDLPQQVALLEQHQADSDWDSLGEVAHRLHGACAVCGVPALKAAVYNLERSAQQREPDDIAAYMRSVGTCCIQLYTLDISRNQTRQFSAE